MRTTESIELVEVRELSTGDIVILQPFKSHRRVKEIIEYPASAQTKIFFTDGTFWWRPWYSSLSVIRESKHEKDNSLGAI